MTARTRIDRIDAIEVLDSRGKPTVAAEIILHGGARGRASVPSGASTGKHEAHELRDGGRRYRGAGVERAVSNVRGVLREAVTGLDAIDQVSVDAAIHSVDSSEGFLTVGANAALAVSVATALAAAQQQMLELYEWAAEVAGTTPSLPMPMVNIVSGGAHAGGLLDVQDFLVVPNAASSFREAIEWAARVRASSSAVANTQGFATTLVADEGGLGLPLSSNRDALALVVKGIEDSGLKPGGQISLAIDVAANQFNSSTGYLLRTEDRTLSGDEWIDELVEWMRCFPIVSIEDPLGEDDWEHWKRITERREPGVEIVGDDLFVTNRDRLARGIREGAATSVLIKPNQIGTLSDALDVLRLARTAGYSAVLSARSGETEDSWMSDLAVGWSVGQIKVGSTMRSERTAKWNRLLWIEHELASTARFGVDAPASIHSRS